MADARDLARQMQSLRMARTMRNGHAMHRIPRPSAVMALVIPLLAFEIRGATRATIAMEARSLQPGRARSQLPQPGITRFDMLASTVGLVTLWAAVMLG
ncbi:MAG: hypothetical protein EA407_12965 [Rhodobacteraceae bacterium]|nr:MAG: hypothetical protein EA407_12965 [Paracoccaceae bacterium]